MELHKIIEAVRHFPSLKPSDVTYNERGLLIRGVEFTYKNPRMAFAKVLAAYSFLPNENDISPTATIGQNTIIGGPGFGYEREDDGKLFRVPHLGNVVIEDRVEIGSNTCIDRGVTGSTVIGEGTKIDNLVHVAHNVRIGKNCLIVAGSTIGGSCEIGDNVFIGINASIKQKVKIGSGAVIGMAAIVLSDVPDGLTVYGVWNTKTKDSA